MTDTAITPADVDAALAEFKDPESGRSITQLQQVADVALEANRLSLVLKLTSFVAPLWEETREALIAHLRARLSGLTDVSVTLGVEERPAEKIGQIGLAAKAVIAVGSGKGGVGKSTIAASIATALHRAGCKVGLMDADVYGPSVPHLFGIEGRPEVDEGRIRPADADGMKIMSMGLLVPPGEAVIWRGPMLHDAITQFLRDTAWGNLDYLFIDLPPGTGDIALTLSQLLPLTGAIVVCTPQDVALLDAVKAVSMFDKVGIKVLGMVENMSYFECPNCQKRYDIFGHGGARRRAEELKLPFLGEVPINIAIREHGDAGRVGASFDDPTTAGPLEALGHRLCRNLAESRSQEPPLPSLSVLS